MTKPIHITVTSTALNPRKAGIKCVKSVADQSFRDYTHYYIDARSDDGSWGLVTAQAHDNLVCSYNPVRQSVFDNLLPLWRSLPDDEVIVWLDGDDWLAHDRVLEIVAKAHQDGAWVTYGSFMYADGTPGFAAQVGADPRGEPWRATHLKTFRAGLVKRIRNEDLLIVGKSKKYASVSFEKYTELVTDQNIMLPLLEMAGKRAVFIPQILYVYNFDHSLQKTSPSEVEFLKKEHDEVRRIRGLPRYDLIESLVSGKVEQFALGQKEERMSSQVQQPYEQSIVLAIMAGKGASEERLNKCIQSAKPYVSKVFLLDTGLANGDSPVSVDFVSHAKWVDDFGVMRNTLLERASVGGDNDSHNPNWVLMLDSDEWLETGMSPDTFRRWLDLVAHESLRVETIHLKAGSGLYSQPRIFRTPIVGTFIGRVHEAYNNFGVSINTALLRFGETPKTHDELKVKFARDLEVLTTDLVRDPLSARTHFYLGENYRFQGNHLLAGNHYRACATLSSWDEERAWASWRTSVELAEQGMWEQAIKESLLGMASFPSMPELPWHAGFCAGKIGHHSEAIAFALMTVAVNQMAHKPERRLFKHLPAHDEGPYDILHWSYLALGDTDRANAAKAEWESRKTKVG